MPTPLGKLPSNQPIPNGRVQIFRGQGSGSELHGPGNYQVLLDGNSAPFRIAYTPRYECRWVVRANQLYRGYSAGWMRCDYAIILSPADMDGTTVGYQCVMELYDYVAVQWRTWSCNAAFRLGPGIAYTASLYHYYASEGLAERYYGGGVFCRIMGRVVGEGVM